MTEDEELLVKQTLHIVDRYGKLRSKQPRIVDERNEYSFDFKPATNSSSSFSSTSILSSPNQAVFNGAETCSPVGMDQTTMISGIVIFLALQAVLLIVWTLMWKRRRSEQAKEVIMLPDNSTDSLSYMYETGFTRRLQ